MFVAHHRGQGCSTHGGKSHLKEGTNAANDFWSIPVIPLWKEFGHSPANGEPSHTHREDQCAQEIADGCGLTCVPIRRWTFPVSNGEVVVFLGLPMRVLWCIKVYLKIRPSNHTKMSDFCEASRKDRGMAVWLLHVRWPPSTGWSY